jgi:very-long-chain (3R)-3-hydroxyacyl-CoA dehydratase
MPAKKATTKPPGAAGKKPAASGLTRIYLFLYNLVSLGLWASCTLRTALLIPQHLEQHGTLSAIFAQVFPLLALTQSLAALEIVHSLVGLVRAPVMTTAMQVASRFLVVWGVMFAFHEGSEYVPRGAGILGAAGGDTQYGDYGFLGCMFAWGITECIRYGFFAMQLAGVGVPGFWLWLRWVLLFLLRFFCTQTDCDFAATIPSSSSILLESHPSVRSCTSAWNPLLSM